MNAPLPPFPIGARLRPIHKSDQWMGEKIVTRWEPMRFANGTVEYVLWVKRADGVEHYHRHADKTFELIEEENHA